MLCGSPPYEGDNVMEGLHKKANELPKPLSELRPALPPAVIGLVERSMARSPDDRPRSMADLAYEIHTIETALVMTPTPLLMTTPGAASRDDLSGRSAFGERSETHIVRPFANRQRAAIIAVAVSGILFAFGVTWLVHALRNRSSDPVPVPVAAVTPPPVPELRPALLEPASDGGAGLDAGTVGLDADPVQEPESKEPGPAPDSSEASKREGTSHSSTRPVVPTTKQSDESLHAAQQLLHAQRFDEARTAFGKLLGEKRSRGAAAAGLAKVAFQEKKYKEAVDRAKESAKWGGGAEARVLLGDAYFKLERFDEAKKAYSEALKLDPNNRVAGQGLRLVESQQ